MKYFLTLLTVLSLSACGDDGKNTAEELNIFHIESLSSQQINESTSLLGLWQSDQYQHNGLSMQIRWQVLTNQTTVAKKCTTSEGLSYYVQVTSSINSSGSHENGVTTTSITLSSADKKTDLVEMTDGKVCRVSIDPQSGPNQFIVEGDGQEFELSNSTIKNGVIELNYKEESRTGTLTKINN